MKKALTLLLIAAFCVGLAGCAKKADETKAIEDVKAEAEKMDVDDLQKMVDTYKDEIADKAEDVKKIEAELKEIPLTEMLGEKAKGIKDDLSEVQKSVSNLTERMEIYAAELKKKSEVAAK